MSRPTRHDCGCTSTDRAWVTMCDKHRAEHAELHERAANEHDAQERTDAPFLAVGNDELGAPVGEMGDCPHCRGRHLIEYGEKMLPDGTREPSRLLGFVRCDDGKAYVCAINGHALEAAS